MANADPKCNQRQARYILTTLCDFILEIVAVFFGVLGAFELDNYRDRKAEDKERVRVLGLIRREVDSNKHILDGMVLVEKDEVIGVPTSRPMRNIWEGITSKLAILTNYELLEEATLLYFDLANLDGILDMYREHVGEYHYVSLEEKARMEPTLRSQRTHYVSYIEQTVLPQIPKVLKLIDAELAGKTPKIERVPSRNGGKHVP